MATPEQIEKNVKRPLKSRDLLLRRDAKSDEILFYEIINRVLSDFGIRYDTRNYFPGIGYGKLESPFYYNHGGWEDVILEEDRTDLKHE